jgi:branched-subunit amino acid transport protein
MSPTLTFWVIIIGLAVGSWLMRAMPLLLHGRVALPPWAERLLRHTPVAAITALVVPGSLYLKANGVYEFAPARTIAAVIALGVALKTRNAVWTLLVGMVALWVTQWGMSLLG